MLETTLISQSIASRRCDLFIIHLFRGMDAGSPQLGVVVVPPRSSYLHKVRYVAMASIVPKMSQGYARPPSVAGHRTVDAAAVQSVEKVSDPSLLPHRSSHR
ncbi:RNA-directed DNA polymerase [Anopheles sinensis]|uniref:RNA-directed DNA polymerase n=1 Tax=Anopheles sinensis TaxID=74873 RepID=A0A084W642_ANOSI|nr:RNA-directed DNA polymerase [Anopheles sinensis]